jgi:hypothetical protein
MKSQINIRASDLLQRQLDGLTTQLGTSITETVSIAIDRMYQQEIGTVTAQTRRQQLISKIASIAYYYHMTESDLATANKVGWNIDIRFSDGQYTNENSWSRVEDIHLDASELDEVGRIVAAFEKYPNRNPEQIVKEVRAAN